MTRERFHSELLGLLGRGCSGAGLRLPVRRGRPAWVEHAGRRLLLRWSGALEPLPTLELSAGRRTAEIVGEAAVATGTLLAPATIATYPDVIWAANTVYHFAIVDVGGGGVPTRIDPLAVVSRATDGSGALRRWLPNAPGSLWARRVAADVPVLRWSYSAFGQQVEPVEFRVFARDEDTPWNFAAAIGSVPYVAGQQHYEWVGAALSAGAVRYYTVRAISAAGVLSLIPQKRGGLAASYDDVDKAACPVLVIESSPPAWLEDVFAESDARALQ